MMKMRSTRPKYAYKIEWIEKKDPPERVNDDFFLTFKSRRTHNSVSSAKWWMTVSNDDRNDETMLNWAGAQCIRFHFHFIHCSNYFMANYVTWAGAGSL